MARITGGLRSITFARTQVANRTRSIEVVLWIGSFCSIVETNNNKIATCIPLIARMWDMPAC